MHIYPHLLRGWVHNFTPGSNNYKLKHSPYFNSTLSQKLTPPRVTKNPCNCTIRPLRTYLVPCLMSM